MSFFYTCIDLTPFSFSVCIYQFCLTASVTSHVGVRCVCRFECEISSVDILSPAAGTVLEGSGSLGSRDSQEKVGCGEQDLSFITWALVLSPVFFLTEKPMCTVTMLLRPRIPYPGRQEGLERELRRGLPSLR